MLDINTIHNMDCIRGMKMLPDEFVQCCVTSPPYWGLRDYGAEGQYGLESTPEEYVLKMVEVFTEVKRLLKPDGILWLNVGDAYWGSGKAGTDRRYQERHTEFGKPSKHSSRFGIPTTGKHPTLKAKDLIGLPWAIAFALRDSGWYLRQDIIWSKPNAMPESATDRCTRSHEYIFLLAKQPRYYFDQDAIKTTIKQGSIDRLKRGMSEKNKYVNGIPGQPAQKLNKPRKKINKRAIPTSGDRQGIDGQSGHFDENGGIIGGGLVNKRSVWTVTTKSFKGAHFATYPEDLIVDCIKAGSRENDIVFDPFMGAGTTAVVAALLNRRYLGFELNQEYVKIANKRLKDRLGLFFK